MTSASAAPGFTRTAGQPRGPLRLAWLIGASWLIRWTGIPPVDWDTPNRPHNPDQPRSGQRQNAFFGTPAQGVGMLASWGSGSITVRVCFGYLA